MKLKQLKKILEGLTPDQLNQDLLYNSKTHSVSGVVTGLRKAKANLYVYYDDDPSPLYTKSQLKEQGLDTDEIEECSIEIPKGNFYLSF